MLQIVRISANPNLAGLVKRIIFRTKRPGFIDSTDFLKKAWKEHVHRRKKVLSLAAVTDGASHDHDHHPAPQRKITSEPPENLAFENFHELIEVAESECSYCHDQSLRSQYDCIEAKYLQWRSWHHHRQDILMLTRAFSRLPNLLRIQIDNGDAERNERASDEVADTALGIPPFFIRPRYNLCPLHWSNNNLLEVVLQAAWPLQQAEVEFPTNPFAKRIYGPQAGFYLALGRLAVFIPQKIEAGILVDCDIENLALKLGNARCGKRMFCGFLLVSSIDMRAPVVVTPEEVYEFLQSIQVLQSLILFSTNDSPTAHHLPPDSVHMRSLLSCNSLTHLSSLVLCGFWILQSSIVECLKAAASNLRSVRLYRITMSEGHWTSVFDQLGDQFYLDTLNLELWDCTPKLVRFGRKEVHDVMDWMCGRSDFHPLRMMDADWIGDSQR